MHSPSAIAEAIIAHAESAGQGTTEYLASEHGRAVAAALAAQRPQPQPPRILHLELRGTGGDHGLALAVAFGLRTSL
jgi:hypothetical protein